MLLNIKQEGSINGRVIFIYLFIFSLFNDAFSISDYTASNDRMRMIVNSELERM
jgi:hypothetical protein